VVATDALGNPTTTIPDEFPVTTAYEPRQFQLGVKVQFWDIHEDRSRPGTRRSPRRQTPPIREVVRVPVHDEGREIQIGSGSPKGPAYHAASSWSVRPREESNAACDGLRG